jgi:hypothetical protein
MLLCLLVAGLSGCHSAPGVQVAPSSNRLPAVNSHVRFTDIARQAGIEVRHHTGAFGKKYMPETVGSGVAFLDYDNDGWQDLLIVDSTDWPEHRTAGSAHNTLRLYHNNRNGTFTDVTKAAGLDIEIYGMGVAVGDYDNDGYEDIYVTSIGPNHLFRNTLGDPNRNGPIFRDVTEQAGVQGVPYPGTELKWKWSTSAAWFDYDNDGKLDLFVCQYVQWSPSRDRYCGHYGVRGYCPPDIYEPSYCTLYHNEGGGRFRDVSDEMGIRSPHARGKSFGVAIGDFNDDGWPDIAVSNDTWPNFLFINDHGKRFVERGVESGIALSENGKAKAGMGIDAADWNNDGHLGLAIGNFTGESISLLENQGEMLFSDQSHPEGIAEPSLLFLTFGLFFADVDLDGRQDLFAANGHIDDVVASYSRYTFRQRPLLFLNQARGGFKESGVEAGLDAKLVARGAAFGDIDNDGYPDIAVVDNAGAFRLYHNDGGLGHHWIRFRTEGVKSNRDGIGARIRVVSGQVTQTRFVRSGAFLSENQRAASFGLGKTGAIDRVEVRWPSGAIDSSGPLQPDQQYLVTEGHGFQRDPRLQTGR